MTYVVNILPKAGECSHYLSMISLWLAKHSQAGAERWLDALQAAVDSLASGPERYAYAPERTRLKRPIRQYLFGTPRGRVYRLLYLVEGSEVRILRVRAPGQRLIRRTDIEEGG
jgi:plasmid stabilization system protein ParE